LIILPALSDGLPTEGEPRCAGKFFTYNTTRLT